MYDVTSVCFCNYIILKNVIQLKIQVCLRPKSHPRTLPKRPLRNRRIHLLKTQPDLRVLNPRKILQKILHFHQLELLPRTQQDRLRPSLPTRQLLSRQKLPQRSHLQARPRALRQHRHLAPLRKVCEPLKSCPYGGGNRSQINSRGGVKGDSFTTFRNEGETYHHNIEFSNTSCMM